MSSISSSLKIEPLRNEFTAVKGFFLLALPLMLLASSQSVANSVNGLFLANFSTSALQAHAIGSALIALFQNACIRMASEAQIFVSQANSSDQKKKVGVYVWQMIWLSLLSIFITLPLAHLISYFYFDQSLLQQEAKEYFQLAMFGNFLFPLSMALSSFYSGRGKQKVLLIATGAFIVIHIAIAKLMIGSYGLKGAAYTQILSQFLYGAVLFALIMRKQNRVQFGTDQWKIQLRPIVSSLRVGAFNGLSAALMSLSWTFIVKIIADKGSDYLTIVAFGNSCAVFLSFLNLGIGQAIAIKVSALIGQKKYHLIWHSVRSASLVVMAILCLLFPFLILFPDLILTLFFPDLIDRFSPEFCQMMRYSCRWLWIFELVGAVDRITRGLLTAAGDTIYMFINYVILLSAGCCFPIYLAISVWNFSPRSFWALMTVTIFFRNTPLYFRLKRELWRTREPILT